MVNFFAGIDTVTNNLGMSFETIILIVVLLGTLVFYAKDFRLGLVLSFFLSALCMVWFYVLEVNYVPALVFTILFLIFMSFNLISVSKQGQAGSII